MSTAISVLVTTEDADVRLDRWLRRRYPKVQQGRLEKLFRTGQIRVDGSRVKGSLRLVPGTSVRIPPIMGSAAFLIADFTRTPYLEEAKSAALPAFLYRFAVYFMVH